MSFDRLSERAAAEDPADDWGVHTRFDDQSNGGYGCVRQVRVSRRELSVHLAKPLGQLAGVDGFDVELAIDDELYARVRTGLARIFRDMPGVLVAADSPPATDQS